METKPFSLQSPERIAKEYAGNKQKIGQAAQMGLLDPTAALLAGMFIDRMRSAAMQEQAPQQTVAQQVFAPPAPPQPQMGLGAIAPQGAPQMPPAPMAPPPPPQQAPVGMASGGAVGEGAYAGGGGLTLLDLPDSMFDEPNNGGYAGGGIVAFAGGGDTDEVILSEDSPWLQPLFSDRGIIATAGRALDRADRETAARNRANRGRVYKVGDRYVDERGFPVTMRSGDQYLIGETTPALIGPSIRAKRGAEAQVYGGAAPRATPTAPATGLTAIALKDPSKFVSPDRSFTVDKAPAESSGRPPAGAPSRSSGLGATAATAAAAAGIPIPGVPQSGNTLTPEQQAADTRKFLQMASEFYGTPGGPGSAIAEQEAELKKLRSPEALAKRKKEDMWMALAQIGANMAASKSPYFLQSAGEAMREALPGVAAAAKDRRQEQREALKQAVDMELMQYGIKTKTVDAAMKLYADFQDNRNKGRDREQAWNIAVMNNNTNLKQIAATQEGNQLQYKAALANANAQGSYLKYNQEVQLNAKVQDIVSKEFDTGGRLYSAYRDVKKKDPAAAEKMVQDRFDAVKTQLMKRSGVPSAQDPLGLRG